VSPNSQLPPRVLYSTHTPRHIIQKPSQTTILLRIFSHPASNRHTRKVFSAMFRLLFRFVSFLFCSAPARNVSGVCVCVCVCISKAKQSKERKKLEKTSGSRHVMDRTGRCMGQFTKRRRRKALFVSFLPSFLPSSFG